MPELYWQNSSDMTKHCRNNMAYLDQEFAPNGQSWDDIHKELRNRRTSADDLKWDDLHNMKASYNAGDDVARVAWDAYTMFRGDNLLYGATLYKSVQSLSDDIVNMVLDLLQAPAGASGTVTTGGTESILLAIRAAYRLASSTRKFKGKPNMVIPYHAHAAFDKAASLMELDVIRVPIDDYRADIGAMADAVTPDTFMLVGSAPAYPLGHVDDIQNLGALAREQGLWLHVDACVGGFFLPFARELGETVPEFDFSLPDVCSMSVDLHKYGYTARGASLVLVREESFTDYHRFDFDSWPTGTFNTPTLTGSRPAGAVASAWAVMNYLGRDGYVERVAGILESRAAIINAIEKTDGIVRCGEPDAGIVGFHCSDGSLDMFAVRDGLTARGWQTGVVMQPEGFQVLLNHRHGEVADAFGERPVGDRCSRSPRRAEGQRRRPVLRRLTDAGFAGFQRMVARKAFTTDLPGQCRLHLTTTVCTAGASRCKRTPGGAMQRAGNLALQGRKLTPPTRLDSRNSLQQRFRVRVTWVFEQSPDRTALHNAAEIHHHHPIGNEIGRRQIVRDKQIAQPALFL